jgi:hypothetical protein
MSDNSVTCLLGDHTKEKKMNVKTSIITALAGLIAISMLTSASAQSSKMPTDPIGGKPPAASKRSVKDLDYQVKYQRAFEAVIWGIPTVAIYGYEKGLRKLGAEPNTIGAFSGPAKAYFETPTPNNVTPYIVAYTDLRDGPVVLEIPPASDEASLYGQIVDHWQVTIANVGPSGLDEGKGGKILLTPPGYNEKVPDGYIEVKSPSYRLGFGLRSIPGPNSTTEKAYAYSKTLKMYYLSELPNPEPTKFLDPRNQRYSTLPPYDETFFEDLHAIFSVENGLPRDKVMMGMLASLGIEKGKPYNPDEKTLKAMRQAAIDAFHYMREMFLEVKPEELFWEDRQWRYALYADPNKGFSWETDDLIDIDSRATHPYSWGTYFPNEMPERPATVYLTATKDKAGKALQGGKTYSVTFPADMPVEQFCSLTLYEFETMAFIYNKEGVQGLSSYDLEKMKKNEDGGVTLYFGPKAPKGLDSNWIPTAGKRPFPIVRYYTPTEAFWDKSVKISDVKLVK